MAACQAVLNTYELLENIVKRLPAWQILDVKTINTTWLAVIKRSEDIQYASRCLTPDKCEACERKADHTPMIPLYHKKSPIAFHPALQPVRSYYQQCSHGLKCDGTFDTCTSVVNFEIPIVSGRNDLTLSAFQTIPRTTSLTARPIKALWLYVGWRSPPHPWLTLVAECLSAEDGLTFGDLLDPISSALTGGIWTGCQIRAVAKMSMKTDWSPWALGGPE